MRGTPVRVSRPGCVDGPLTRPGGGDRLGRRPTFRTEAARPRVESSLHLDGEAMSQLSPSNTPTTPMETAPAPERPSRGRSIAAVICLVLAGLLTTPAAVAYWGQRTL